MLRSALAKVAWVGRTASMVFGLALVLALLFGVATSAFGANGNNFVLGSIQNAATQVTGLVGNVDGAALQVTNPNAGTNDTALDLRVQASEAPMRVNSSTKVTNLNSDKLDGKDFGDFGVTKVMHAAGPLPTQKTFITKGGTLVISASGSGFRADGQSLRVGHIGMDVVFDNEWMGDVSVYTNERNSHKAFVANDFVLFAVPAGEHTLRLEEKYKVGVCNTPQESASTFCTDTDFNDIFNVTLMEIPD